MKSTGIVRRIDDLGRVVVPKEIRRTLNVEEGDPLELFIEDGNIVWKKYSFEDNYEKILNTKEQTEDTDAQFEAFGDNIVKEMEEFKHSYDSMSSTQIYNDWYIIGFKESFYDLFTECDIPDNKLDDVILWLSKQEKPLQFLYDIWLCCDGAMSYDYNDMIGWLLEIYERRNLQ